MWDVVVLLGILLALLVLFSFIVKYVLPKCGAMG